MALDSSVNKLIIGASRTESSINNDLSNSFNISGAGEALLFTKIKLEAYKNYNLQIDTIILSLDNRTLNSIKGHNWYSSEHLKLRVPKLSHFIKYDEWIMLNEIDLSSTLRSITFAPKYSLKLIKAIFNKKEDAFYDIKLGGYKPVDHVIGQDVINDFIVNDTIKGYKLSRFEIENLFEIIKFCKSNKLTLILLNPPLHPVMYNSVQYQEGKEVFDKFVVKYLSDLTYLDFSNIFLPDSCYADLVHINKNGASIFSKELEQVLKSKNSDY